MTKVQILRDALGKALRGVTVAKLGLAIDGVQHAKLVQIEKAISTALATPVKRSGDTSATIIEDAVAFIEGLTAVPLLMDDDIEMRLEDVQAHARVEAASLRKRLADRSTLPVQPEAPGVEVGELRERIAEAIWEGGYGSYRRKRNPDVKWPDYVVGGSQDLFRRMADYVLAAVATTPDEERIQREVARMGERIASDLERNADNLSPARPHPCPANAMLDAAKELRSATDFAFHDKAVTARSEGEDCICGEAG